jgi:elongation of very long chain fatty acids protein 1
MKTPLPLIATFLVYFLIVFKIAPAYMKDRKPLNISRIIQIYNVLQVIACAYFVYQFHGIGFTFRNTWKCVNDIQPNLQKKSFDLVWWFILLRAAELVETVFFILRKKQNQVSNLHLYHHISTLVVVWSGLKYQIGKWIWFQLVLVFTLLV